MWYIYCLKEMNVKLLFWRYYAVIEIKALDSGLQNDCFYDIHFFWMDYPVHIIYVFDSSI